MYQKSVQEATATVSASCFVTASAFAVELFTNSHLNASLLTMKLARRIEETAKERQEYSAQEYSQMRSDYISYSASSIISSVAALESNINEILFLKNIENCLNVIEQSIYKESTALSKYKFDSKRSVLDQFEYNSSIIFKYQIIAFLLNGEFICRDKKTKIEDVEYLICIRNALVHFSPEVEAELMGQSFELKRHAHLKKSKKNRFPYSPLFGEEYVSFRNSMIHAGSAEWAYNTAKDFIGFYDKTIVSKWPSAKPL